MIAKTNYEEINMILGHFVCLVEGVELQAPRLGASNQGWYTHWQVSLSCYSLLPPLRFSSAIPAR